PNAAAGPLPGRQGAAEQVQQAIARVVAAPNTKIVADATAPDSQSPDANAPAALKSLGVDASTQLNGTADTSRPILGIRRHDRDVDYYQLFNPSETSTVHQSVTLTGHGIPYLLDTWTGKII